MHRILKEKLAGAHGVSEHIIAVFVDIRSFADFASMHESVEAALFLKKVYMAVLDDYFVESDFFKPTGDGLMLIYKFDDDSLAERTNSVVETSCRLVDDFSSILDHDPAVNFTTPDHVGIGISRGAATRLTTDDVSLDYSGRPLNIAARLMDLARPEGVVLDAGVRPEDLLTDDLQGKFDTDYVYVKGIAESEPMLVYYLADRTQIPETAHEPIGVYEWHEQRYEVNFSRLRQRRGIRFWYSLQRRPSFPAELTLAIHYPKPTAAGRKGRSTLWLEFPLTYAEQAGEPAANLIFDRVIDQLEGLGVRDNWELSERITYRTAPTA